MSRRGALGKDSVDDEARWSASDIVAMCLAMFDTIGPGLLVIAGIMVVISTVVTVFMR